MAHEEYWWSRLLIVVLTWLAICSLAVLLIFVL